MEGEVDTGVALAAMWNARACVNEKVNHAKRWRKERPRCTDETALEEVSGENCMQESTTSGGDNGEGGDREEGVGTQFQAGVGTAQGPLNVLPFLTK